MINWLAALYAWHKKVCRQQQAWRWWYQQNTLQSYSVAETIRDGPLQQAFALRRSIETAGWPVGEFPLKSGTAQISAEQTAHWLETFQTLYQTLASLSDQLSPPFVADSLPLALQYTLKNFTLRQSAEPLAHNSISSLANGELNFDLNIIPASWPLAHCHQNQAILSIVTSLLRLILPTSRLAQPIMLTLNYKDSLNTLTLHFQPVANCPRLALAKLAEIQHLKEIFHSLTAGQLTVNQTANSLMGRLCWQNEEGPCPARSNAL
jgi:hypothetical protein